MRSDMDTNRTMDRATTTETVYRRWATPRDRDGGVMKWWRAMKGASKSERCRLLRQGQARERRREEASR